MTIMPEEIEQGEVGEPTHEPKNVREAIAMRQAQGDPGFVEVTEEEAHKPYSDATINDDDEILFNEPEAEAPATAPEPATPEPSADDPYKSFGGEQRVRDAVVIADALQTEQGVRAVVAQGLQALGYSTAQIQAALAGQQVEGAAPAGAPAPAADPYADIPDDEVVTGAELKTLLASFATSIEQSVLAAQETATQPLQAQIQEQRSRDARNSVDSTLIEVLKIEDPAKISDLQKEQIADVQSFAAKYLDPNDWDPANIRNAIIRGHADMAARDERRLQAYVKAKREARAAQPAHIGGASSGAEEVKEPRNVKEAIAMRKAQGVS